MLEILERITEGKAKEGDLELLEELSGGIKDGSLCGLGQTAPNPVLTTLKYFRDEYEEHLYNKKCPSKECTGLLTYTIIAKNCIGCSACAKKCPANAIHGEPKKVYEICQDECIKCGQCLITCKFDAIVAE
jgi:NADH-quinone oxidoreductase subunit F